MPQAAAAIAATFFAAATAVGVSAGVAATFAVLATNALAYATNAFLLNKALGALQKRGRTGETRGLEVSITDSTAEARVLYGEVRTSGVNIIPPVTSGSNGEHLHQVLALAMHEIDSVQAYYFDQDTLPAPAAVSGGAGDGLIASGKYSGAAWVRAYLGTMTQTVDFKLNAAFPSQWASTARGRGIAYVALTYDYGKGKIFSGIPQVTFKIRGAKVYDPRLDSTNGGAGTHRYATPSTWAYSNNPALCWANYKIAGYGYGLDPATEIDWVAVAAAADRCDALVANKDGGTSKRYTCNGVLINTPESLDDNQRKLVDAMFGRQTLVNGVWACYAGGWEVPEWTIASTDWLSIENIQTVGGRDGARFNGVHCFYVSPERNWQRVECYPRRNPTYKSADAAEGIEIEMEQPMCTDESEAQRKAEFLLRTSRNGVKLVGILPPRFQKIRTFATVALNFAELGWVSKSFRVSAFTQNMDGSCRVALTEEQDTEWTDLLLAEYGTLSVSTIPAVNPTVPGAPQNLVITPFSGALNLDWDSPVTAPLGTRYRIIASPNSANAAVGSVIWEGDADVALVPWTATNSRYWWYVQAAVNTYSGPYYPNTFGLLAMPSLPPNISRYPIVDPFFASGYTVGSYWDVDFSAGSGGFMQPSQGQGLTADSGVAEFAGSVGALRGVVQPTRACVPGEIDGGVRFRLSPRQTVSISASVREMQDFGAGGGGNFKLYMTLMGPSVSTNIFNGLNMVTLGSGSWTHYVNSIQLPNSLQYGEAFIQVNLDINSAGRYQIGRLDVSLT